MDIKKFSGFVKTVKGEQQVIGNKTTKFYRLSILEIGDDVLQNISLPEQLSIFVNAGQEISIWLIGVNIVALQRADGKVFVVAHEKPGKFSFILGIVLIPMYGLGLLVLWGRYSANKHYYALERILSQFPSYENLKL